MEEADPRELTLCAEPELCASFMQLLLAVLFREFNNMVQYMCMLDAEIVYMYMYMRESSYNVHNTGSCIRNCMCMHIIYCTL